MIRFIITLLIIFLPLTSGLYSSSPYGSDCYSKTCTPQSNEQTTPQDEISDNAEDSGGGRRISSTTKINESQDNIPAELLDITFDLEEDRIIKSQDLISIVTLKSFGGENANVILDYEIYDENNTRIYLYSEDTIVITDRVIIKDFADFKAPVGKYKIVLTVQYAGLVEKFDKEFEISEPLFSPSSRWYIILAILMLITIIVIAKKKKHHSKTFKPGSFSPAR